MLPPSTPNAALQPLSPERREFLVALLDVSVRQLAWPDNAEWEAPTGEDLDPDDDLAILQAKRLVGVSHEWRSCQMCRAYIESIAQIDRNLHKETVARIVIDTLQSSQPTWQQTELALHLVFTFGELAKSKL
jgi:exportin-T